MSRSGYNDGCNGWDLIRWRGAVASAIRGARGQAMLKELLCTLDAMTEKKLIAHELELNGQFCTLGVLGKARAIEINTLDPYDTETLAEKLAVSNALVREIVYENDEGAWSNETPEQRWIRMRRWIASQIKQEAQP